MTRRKRTPSPDRSRKRVAFDIPASLHHFSALSRSLVVQNGVNDENEKENSTIVARAQALSQGIRFKYDPRQFPTQQEWPQPSLNPGAVGHARFLEKQWQTAQATQVAENMRRAQYMRQQMEEEGSITSITLHQTTSNDVLPHPDTRLVPASGNVAGPKAGEPPDDSQPRPEPTPRRGPKRQRFDLGIEQRRQAIISKLMETSPASIGTSSSNIQIPTRTQTEAGSSPPRSVCPADKDGQLNSRTQSEQIAALIVAKRAENAANGSLNRWLSARQEHKQAQEATAKGQSASATQRDLSQSPANPFLFNAHPTRLSSQARVVSGSSSQPLSHDKPAHLASTTQELDLSSLFSSPAPSHNYVNAGGSPQTDERGHGTDKTNATQLPSPSISSPSPPGVRWVPSPSAQLLISLTQTAPVSPLPSQAQHTFRTPSLTVSTEGLARTSSMAQAARAQYLQQQPLPQHTTQQPLPPSPSTNMRPNNPGYYQIKPPLWAPFNTDKFAMATPAFVDNGTADILGQPTTACRVVTNDSGAAAGSIAVGVGSDYALALVL
ncbi:hypothetical protein DV736_g4091, partial [Chaetothyriales sp. CBS 134916]